MFDPNTLEAMAFAIDLESQAVRLFIQDSSGYWLDLLESRGIPAGPDRFVEELFDDPQIQANGLIHEVEHRDAGKVKMMGPMAQFSGTPMAAGRGSPALGEHTWDLLRNLGYSDDDIRRWKDAGVTI